MRQHYGLMLSMALLVAMLVGGLVYLSLNDDSPEYAGDLQSISPSVSSIVYPTAPAGYPTPCPFLASVDTYRVQNEHGLARDLQLLLESNDIPASVGIRLSMQQPGCSDQSIDHIFSGISIDINFYTTSTNLTEMLFLGNVVQHSIDTLETSNLNFQSVTIILSRPSYPRFPDAEIRNWHFTDGLPTNLSYGELYGLGNTPVPTPERHMT